VAGSLRADPRFRVLAAICVFAAAMGIANVIDYDPGGGYDALDHQAYADLLVPGGHFPHGTGEYYTPPGFYALAGSADWVGSKLLGMGEPHRAGSALNILFLVGTIVLVWKIARELWPDRDRIAIGAAAFVALVPVTVKTETMFHPETLSLLTCTFALWLSVRTFANPRYAYPLGVALGLAQLVRLQSLWTVVCVAVALAVGRRRRELATVLVLAALIPAPWYLHQAITYHGDPLFPRPATKLARNDAGKPKPIWERRPWRFYVDPGLPTVISRPYQPHFDNLALPTTYTEMWGDYFGVWVWELKSPVNGFVPPPRPVHAELVVQAVAGLLPTLLALVGSVLFLRASFRSPPRLALALLPLVGILGYLAFTVSYPTAVGDVLKATYMLSTAGAWALGFGFALDRLRGRWQTPVIAALAVCAVAELPFLLTIKY
jgi:hypothetical protein